MRTLRSRRGFALVIALWVLVGGATLAFATSLIARDAIGSARNRELATRDSWLARGCLEVARNAMYESLWPSDFTASSVRANWLALDEAVAASSDYAATECQMRIEPAGLAIDINAASAAQIRRVLLECGLRGPAADSLVDAIIDWQDADDAPRPYGAEREWYVTKRLAPPRNGPFAAIEELFSVRGFTKELAAWQVFDVRPDRVLWRRASRPVLAGLPGMTDEALSILESHGLSEITDLAAIGGFPEMSAAARDTLARDGAALIPMLTTSPEYWRIRASVKTGSQGAEVVAELSVMLADQHLIVLDRFVRP